MRPESVREAREWLTRAERDLLAAERSLGIQPVLGEAAVYHAQQAGEKALKGYLAARDTAFSRTHDLIELVTLCEGLDQSFSHFANAARILTPYAVRFRYPGGPLEPSPGEAVQALQLAREIVQFVESKLAAGDSR
jgi:HEPN domain-containing protein